MLLIEYLCCYCIWEIGLNPLVMNNGINIYMKYLLNPLVLNNSINRVYMKDLLNPLVVNNGINRDYIKVFLNPLVVNNSKLSLIENRVYMKGFRAK